MKRVFVLTLMFIFLLSFNAWAAIDADDLFLEGMKAYVEADYSQAVELFNRVIDLGDDYLADASYYQTMSYFKQGNLSGARDAHDKMKSLGFDHGYLYFIWGEVYLNVDGRWDQDDIERGVEKLERSREMGIDTACLYGHLASAYSTKDEYQLAQRNYQRALLREPTSAIYHSGLANVYLELGEEKRAAEHLKEALNINPDQPGLMVKLGDIYYQIGEVAKFKDMYRQAINNIPRQASLRQQYGIYLYQLEEYDGAIDSLKKAVEINPSTYLPYFYLGRIYEELGELNEARNYYQKTLKYNPQYSNAYLALGDLMLEEQPYLAMARYSEAIEANPDYVAAHFSLARAYHKLDMREAAISQLEKTLRMNPEHEEAARLLEEIQED